MSTVPQQIGDPAELVRRIRAGESAAEREMVERYSRGVFFLLREMTRDEARADDLHQEAFRLAIEKVRGGELKEPEKLAGFIRQLARNLFIAQHRQRAKQPTVDGETLLAFSPDPGPSPQQLLLDKENADIVRRLLAGLEPARDREILMRLFVAEHPREAICNDLGLTNLQFNRALHRARQRLKDLLERHHKRGRLGSVALLAILLEVVER